MLLLSTAFVKTVVLVPKLIETFQHYSENKVKNFFFTRPCLFQAFYPFFYKKKGCSKKNEQGNILLIQNNGKCK
jgi:hypothetical protein